MAKPYRKDLAALEEILHYEQSACVKCEALSHEKETLQEELTTLYSRCGHLEAEKKEATQKRHTLERKVSLLSWALNGNTL